MVTPFAAVRGDSRRLTAAFADSRQRLWKAAIAGRILSPAPLTTESPSHQRSTRRAGTCRRVVALASAHIAVWLMHSASRRRDALRAAGHWPTPQPVYGLAHGGAAAVTRRPLPGELLSTATACTIPRGRPGQQARDTCAAAPDAKPVDTPHPPVPGTKTTRPGCHSQPPHGHRLRPRPTDHPPADGRGLGPVDRRRPIYPRSPRLPTPHVQTLAAASPPPSGSTNPPRRCPSPTCCA